MIKTWFSSLLFAFALEGDFFQNAGKIYVVVVVLTIIFIGIIAFLFRLDKRISRFEKHIEDGE